MAGNGRLRDRLRDKLKIRSSSKDSDAPANNARFPQPSVACTSGPAPESDRIALTDTTDPAISLILTAEGAPRKPETTARPEAKEHSLSDPLIPTDCTSASATEGRDLVVRTKNDLVQSKRSDIESAQLQHVDLWDRSYELLRARDESLVEKYEKILDNELKASIRSNVVLGAVTSVGMSLGLAGQSSTPNATDAATTLALHGTPGRQEQMKSLVEYKIKKYEDSAWKFKIGSKSIIVRDQTEKFVKTIMFAKSLVDSTVASDPHVALAWTGVCILLPLIVIPSKQRAAQSKGLSDVADLIQHYYTVEKVYRGKQAADTIDQGFKDDFEDKLSMLYSQILEYQAQTICQISRSVLLRSFSLPSTWESLLTEIKKSDTICKEKARLLTDFRINEIRIETQKLSKNLETRFNELENSSLRGNIRQWLLPPILLTGEDGVTAHDRHCMDREVDTCRWYIEGSHFQDWLQSTSQVLWLYGDVGCGKTVMCSAIVEKLKDLGICQDVYRTALDAVDIAKSSIAYFYFSFDSSAIQDPNYFLRAVVAQLCLGDTVHPQLAEAYRNTRGWSAPSYENLVEILLAVVTDDEEDQSFSENNSSANAKSIFLVLDGLDEIPKDRDKLFKLIRNLVSVESSRLRIIVTSRWQSNIETMLRQSTKLTPYEIPRKEVEIDIKSYLVAQIAHDYRFSSPVKERICERLSDGGVFRLAALQLQVLQQYPLTSLSLQDLEEILRTLPKQLAECYDRILENIPKVPGKLRPCFSRALKWIALSQRPLYIEEVAEACMIDANRRFIDTTRFISSRDVVTNLLGLVRIEPPLRGLIEFAPPSQAHTVSVAHFSVQEYLVSYDGFSPLPGLGRFDAALAQTFIAQSCLTYLCACNASWTQIWPLKAYAWTYWAAHTQAANSCLQGIHIQPAALRLFNEVAFPLLYSYPHPDQTWTKKTPSWLAFEEIRKCLPLNQHEGLLEILRDPTFAEDLISHYEHRKEYQGSKSERAIETNCPAESPIYIKRSRNIPEKYYRTSEEQKLKHRPLLLDSLSIRLLVVLPSADKYSTIECHLCSDSLYNKPKYTALAYAWGTSHRRYGILVNGQSFYVRENLWHALHELRDVEQPRVLWIDSICIDMQNVTEQGSQVRLMTEVYGSAEQVCVWLGAKTGGDQTFNDRFDSIEESEVGLTILEAPSDVPAFSAAMTQYREYLSLEAPVILPHLSPLWKRAMEKVLKIIRDNYYKRRRGNWVWKGDTIFNQRFWRSCWIVQEVVVAAEVTVRLGDFRITWEDIPDVREFYEFLDYPGNCIARPRRIGDTRITGGNRKFHPFHLGWAAVETLQKLRKRYQSGQELTLPELLNLTRYHYSSNSRDKIFAIFTILPDHEKNHHLLQPNYSLSLADVYTNAAEYILARYQSLDILSLCHGIPESYRWAIHDPRDPEGGTIDQEHNNKRSNFRSWVPNWTADSGIPLSPGIFSPKQEALFNAGGSICYFRINTENQLRTLTVKGIIIDCVGSVVRMFPDFDRQKFVMREFRNGFREYNALDPTLYPLGQSLPEVFWRTILTDRWISDKGDASRLPTDYIAILDNVTWKHWDLVETSERRLENDLLCMKCSISKAGRSVMVPWDAEPGDVIVVLAGGKVPYVLRKQDDLDGEYYRLVAECYVHGMMDGEALGESAPMFQEFSLI